MITPLNTATETPRGTDRRPVARPLVPTQPEHLTPNPNVELQQGIKNVRHLVEKRRQVDVETQLEAVQSRERNPNEITRDAEYSAQQARERNDATLRELDIINDYAAHQEQLERERRKLSDVAQKAAEAIDYANQQHLSESTIKELETNEAVILQNLRDFDLQHIPADLRGDNPIPFENENVRQAYEQQVEPNLSHLRERMNDIRTTPQTTERPEDANTSEVNALPGLDIPLELLSPENGAAQARTEQQRLAESINNMNEEQRRRLILEQDATIRSAWTVLRNSLGAFGTTNRAMTPTQNLRRELFQLERIFRKFFTNNFQRPEPEQSGQVRNQPVEDHTGPQTQVEPAQTIARPQEYLEPQEQPESSGNENQSGQASMVDPDQYNRSKDIVFAAIAKGAINVTNGPEVIDAASDVIRFVEQKRFTHEPIDPGLEEFANRATDIQNALLRQQI